jgi:hypothetical protein
MSVAGLRSLCVDRFPLSSTRDAIMTGLEEVATRLDGVAISGELWVDGSFVTEKISPGDADIVLRMDGAFVDNVNLAQWAALQWVIGNLKGTHHCDSYVLIRYPAGHPQYWDGEYWEAYWMRLPTAIRSRCSPRGWCRSRARWAR